MAKMTNPIQMEPEKPKKGPRTKEEAIQQMIKDDPKKAAELLKEILAGKK